MSEESQEREEEQEQSRGFRMTDRRRFSSKSGEPGSAEATDEKIDAVPEKESPVGFFWGLLRQEKNPTGNALVV